MGLFRATIQHRRGMRLLVSRSAHFDELGGVWDDHFISARQIKLPFLDEDASVGLLTKPVARVPGRCDSNRGCSKSLQADRRSAKLAPDFWLTATPLNPHRR